MKSPLTWVIITTLGGYLIVMLALFVYEWIEETFPSPQTKPVVEGRIQHPFYNARAVSTVNWFLELPESEKNRLMNQIQSSMLPLDTWINQLEKSDYQIICLGELHQETTRRIIAEKLFVKMELDVLMLESTPEHLNFLLEKADSDRSYYPLLGADILAVLRTVIEKNPKVHIRGIEGTDTQKGNPNTFSGTRDQTIAKNFRNVFQSGKRHVILFGRLHCAKESNWLFQNIHEQSSAGLQEKMLSISVMGEHQYGPLEAFIYFLDEIGLGRKLFVMIHLEELSRLFSEHFPTLTESIFMKYNAIIVFRS